MAILHPISRWEVNMSWNHQQSQCCTIHRSNCQHLINYQLAQATCVGVEVSSTRLNLFITLCPWESTSTLTPVTLKTFTFGSSISCNSMFIIEIESCSVSLLGLFLWTFCYGTWSPVRLHVPPFWQGEALHGSTAYMQVNPENPAEHWHAKP